MSGAQPITISVLSIPGCSGSGICTKECQASKGQKIQSLAVINVHSAQILLLSVSSILKSGYFKVYSGSFKVCTKKREFDAF